MGHKARSARQGIASDSPPKFPYVAEQGDIAKKEYTFTIDSLVLM